MAITPYRHLLVAADLAPESQPVIDRALDMRERFQARLTLVHVIDSVVDGAEYTGGAFISDPGLPGDPGLEREQLETATREMAALGERIGVPPADRLIESGPTARSILHVARDLGVDLIIVGTHGQGWLSRLFGSTSRTLLAREPCDLLAVLVPSPDGEP